MKRFVVVLMFVVLSVSSFVSDTFAISDEVVPSYTLSEKCITIGLHSAGKLNSFFDNSISFFYRNKDLEEKKLELKDPPIVEKKEGVMIPSNLTEEQLQAGMVYDLKEYAHCFIEAEKKTGINAVFLASIAAGESGWGRYESAPNNIFGWTGTSGYMSFDSVEDCIDYVSMSIKNNYLTPGGKYFNGYTIEAVNMRYNGSQQWVDLINDVNYGINLRMERAGVLVNV